MNGLCNVKRMDMVLIKVPEWSIVFSVCIPTLQRAEGAQWLSGRVLDSTQRGHGFNPHWRHCIVSLSKNINPCLVLVQPWKTRPYITERLLTGHKESNKTKQKPKGRSTYCVSADNLCKQIGTQIRPDKMPGLIWIQTVDTDCIPEIFFSKKVDFEKKRQKKKHEKLPKRQLTCIPHMKTWLQDCIVVYM